MTVRHALRYVAEVGKGFNVVELRGGDEGADGSPTLSPTIGAREQVVLAPERDGPNRTLDRIVVGSIASFRKRQMADQRERA